MTYPGVNTFHHNVSHWSTKTITTILLYIQHVQNNVIDIDLMYLNVQKQVRSWIHCILLVLIHTLRSWLMWTWNEPVKLLYINQCIFYDISLCLLHMIYWLTILKDKWKTGKPIQKQNFRKVLDLKSPSRARWHNSTTYMIDRCPHNPSSLAGTCSRHEI